MDNENTKQPFIIELMRNFTTIFTLSVLAISFASILVLRFIPENQNIPPLFTSGNTFFSIIQIAVSSFILAFFFVLLITERFIYKMRYWLRLLLFLLLALLIFSIAAIIFKWFPADDPQTWLRFILCTIICYILSISLTLLRFRIEGEKYNKLLANYKTRKKNTI